MANVKRVVEFVDMVDEIPINAKYLYSIEREGNTEETEDERVKRLTSNDNKEPIKISFFVHYYEVEENDFKKMVENGWLNLSGKDKTDMFFDRFKKHIKEK